MNPACPICGRALSEQVTTCTRCPMNRGCGMLCCENCGYQTVPNRSAVLERLKRLFARKNPRHA